MSSVDLVLDCIVLDSSVLLESFRVSLELIQILLCNHSVFLDSKNQIHIPVCFLLLLVECFVPSLFLVVGYRVKHLVVF